jgi:hypothetical protein
MDIEAKEPEWHSITPHVDDETLQRLVDEIEKAKPLLAQDLYRDQELTELTQRASNAYEGTADHNSIQYRKYDRDRRQFTRWREVSRSGYVGNDDAHHLFDLQQQIVELLNLHGVDIQTTELFIAPRTPYTARVYLRNILSRAKTSIDLKDDYLFSANQTTFNIDLLNILQPYMASSLNITARLLGSDQILGSRSNPATLPTLVSDAKAFIAQYPRAEFKGNAPSAPRETHDRFIIIDRSEVYKVGTSVKDLGTAQSGIDKVEDATVAQQYIAQFDTWWAAAHDYPDLI